MSRPNFLATGVIQINTCQCPKCFNDLNMLYRKISFLIVYFFVGIAFSGCATTSTIEYRAQTIESDSIQAIVEDPSGSMLPLNRGDIIIITTKEKIGVSSRNVNWVRMVLDDANTSRVKGEVEYVSGDVGEGYEDVAGVIVEVQLDNIQKIEVWKTKIAKSKNPLPPFPWREMLTGITIILISIFISGVILL